MDEEVNPIKDYLFDYIKNSQTIPQLISEKKFDVVIDEIIQNCYDKIITLDEKDTAVGVLATGILHYLLTNALVNSQRKVEHQGMELDIVVPDIKTLEKDPKMTLVVYIPKTSDKQIIEEKITQLEKIQPIKENIWVVLSENIPIEQKKFVLTKENSSFSKIIFDIAQFSNVGGANKFKILRI
ncbi:hypothetical protein AAA799B03_00349 [Marine Group I thaumarchaeote SCGC AAA799-B03]|uniref:Uncharacterized protein n=3 Tax=Marine Group I TaxID=905826 RepID=A0A087S8F7_9ARCH|nr:hypothetical protein AAA799N04_00371 [Marine Group I thaumarchaeote SCGC AAA799-N04]KFM18037.1 hypothetical protein SCCGRSA3_01391 [Marine Group I thaumarchaeote SCGC RSA3]KFM22011.1 hypothetical protein AAA799B03_00349 [Marine Group I thaumarchaeote SCGC AAA799-B03]